MTVPATPLSRADFFEQRCKPLVDQLLALCAEVGMAHVMAFCTTADEAKGKHSVVTCASLGSDYPTPDEFYLLMTVLAQDPRATAHVRALAQETFLRLVEPVGGMQ